jgi:hypothetical protein
MTHSLNTLKEAQVQRTILLAELGALFHNVGKMSSLFLHVQREKDKPSKAITEDDFDYEQITGVLSRHLSDRGRVNDRSLPDAIKERVPRDVAEYTMRVLPDSIRDLMWNITLQLPENLRDRIYHLGDFTAFQSSSLYKESRQCPRGAISELFHEGSMATHLLERCHDAVSRAEKDPLQRDPQGAPPTFRASVYGHEEPIDEDALERHRGKFIGAYVTLVRNPTTPERFTLLATMERASHRGVAETRRPLNDVTTWDVCHGAATLFKAALAGAVLGGKWPDFRNLRWRLLRIAFDGLDFLARAHHITDLLGRRATLQAALDAARRVIEVDFPLGNEVYRDENGSVFIVPDAEILSANAGGMTLKKRVLESLDNGGLRGELVPEIEPSGPHPAEALGRHAYHRPKRQPTNRADAAVLARSWQASPGKEVCTVCSLRPVGGGDLDDRRRRIAAARSICGVCLEWRGSRAREWAKALALLSHGSERGARLGPAFQA